jgi:hypothetical protein
MPAAAVTESTDSLTESERNFSQVEVSLFGRYMLESSQEYPCQVIDISPGSAVFIGPVSVQVGERVIAYLDHLGRIEGQVIRIFDGGFAISFKATGRRREKIAAKLTRLSNRQELNLPEDRRDERVTSRNNQSVVKLEDGRVYQSKVIDLSLSGAAVELQVRPAIGTVMWLGTMRGRVVRHFDDGVALEFAVSQTRDSLADYLGSPH